MVSDRLPGNTRNAGTRRPTGARPPRQRRGQARVDAILDSAAVIVAASGLPGVTMHALARHARTSIGSMYHFFPDRESVLSALSDRHAAAVREIGRQLVTLPTQAWRRLPADAAIGHLVGPYVDYLRRHRDYLALLQAQRTSADDTGFIPALMHVLDARIPTVPTDARAAHAAMLHAIAAGTMHMGLQTEPGHADLYLREIPRVLALYLADIEAAAAAP